MEPDSGRLAIVTDGGCAYAPRPEERRALRRVAPPSVKGRPWKLYYGAQVSTAPPTFMAFANQPLPLGNAYRRYLQNRLREALELPGVPIRLVIRKR